MWTLQVCSTVTSLKRKSEIRLRGLCLSLTPGPHAFLPVIQLGRFTEQEKRVMETLEKMLSPSVSEYTIVLFSYGDTSVELFF